MRLFGDFYEDAKKGDKLPSEADFVRAMNLRQILEFTFDLCEEVRQDQAQTS